MVTMKSSRGLPSALADGRFLTRSSQSGTVEYLQLALFQPAQIGDGMEDRAQLVGIAFIKRVEIVLDHGFDARTIVTHVCS